MKRKFFKVLLMLSLFSSVFADEVGIYFFAEKGGVSSLENLEQVIESANAVFENTNSTMHLYIAGVTETDAPISHNGDAVLRQIKNQNPPFSSARLLVEKFGGDFIVAISSYKYIVRDNDNTGIAGLASTVSTSISDLKATSALVLGNDYVDAFTLTHEIGHLMGLAHGDAVATALAEPSSRNGFNNYSRGWGRIVDLVTPGKTPSDENYEMGEFGTIMVGNYTKYFSNTTANIVPLFSNPEIISSECGVGNVSMRCGSIVSGNAAKQISDNIKYFSKHETLDTSAVEFKDENLGSCIVSHYPYTPGNEVNDVDKVSVISCSGNNISYVRGIEKIEGLFTKSGVYIDLSSNHLLDISELLGLSSSATVDLTNNTYIPCPQLDDLSTPQVMEPKLCSQGPVTIAVLGL